MDDVIGLIFAIFVAAVLVYCALAFFSLLVMPIMIIAVLIVPGVIAGMIDEWKHPSDPSEKERWW